MATSDRIDSLKAEYKITDEQLNSKIEEGKFFEIAGHLGNFEFYAGKPGFGFNNTTIADLKACAFTKDYRHAMQIALKIWSENSPSTSPSTYRSLIEILIKLNKYSIAEEVCKIAIAPNTDNISSTANPINSGPGGSYRPTGQARSKEIPHHKVDGLNGQYATTKQSGALNKTLDKVVLQPSKPDTVVSSGGSQAVTVSHRLEGGNAPSESSAPEPEFYSRSPEPPETGGDGKPLDTTIQRSAESLSTEKTPLLHNYNTLCSYSEGYKIGLKYCLASTTISLLVLLLSLTSLIVGTSMFVTLPEGSSKNYTINQTLFAESNDTIILGNLSADIFSNATVEARPEPHEIPRRNKVFLASKLVQHTSQVKIRYDTIQLKYPKRAAGSIENMYSLDSGLIEYTFCATTDSNDETDANAYVFDNEDDYSIYAGQAPGTEASFYVFHQKVAIGKLYHYQCTSFSFPINKPAYYFVAVDIPGDVSYNYSYDIRKIYLDRTDYNMNCELPPIRNNSTCVIDLSTKTGLQYVLVYVEPNIDPLPDAPNSTHLRLFSYASGVEDNNRDSLWTVSVVLMCAGGLLFVCTLCVFLCVCCRYKRSKKGTEYL